MSRISANEVIRDLTFGSPHMPGVMQIAGAGIALGGAVIQGIEAYREVKTLTEAEQRIRQLVGALNTSYIRGQELVAERDALVDEIETVTDELDRAVQANAALSDENAKLRQMLSVRAVA